MRKLIELAKTNPVRFARDVLQLKRLPGEPAPGDKKYKAELDWEMDPWQKELLEAIADVYRKQNNLETVTNHGGKINITVRACQGPGKTFGIAVAAHIFGFAYDPMVIACVAPKLEHLKTRFMGEFSKITHRAIPGYSTLLKMNASSVHWNGVDKLNHFLICETGKQPENIQGLRRQHTLYLVDEASGVEERLWPVTDGNLSATDLGIRVEIGNPTRNTGHFARSHLDNRIAGDYYRMKVGPEDSKRIKKSWVERMEREYGKDSPVVKVRCYGEFASSDERQLVALEWLVRARDFEGDPLGGDGSIGKLRVSVDCAAGGDDETVCTAARHFQEYVVGLRCTRHSFPLATASVETADAAEALFYLFGGKKGEDDFVVDANGVGAGAAGILIDRGHAVILYMGGSKSSNPERWRNRRVQSYLAMRNALRDSRLFYATDFFLDHSHWDDFDAQMCSVRTATTDRLEDLTTKEQMKADGIKSPDIADSQAMQYATQAPTLLSASAISVHQLAELISMQPNELLDNWPSQAA